MKDQLRCQHCGDLIGVYEPLIRIADGHPHETSRAAHAQPGETAGPCYHRACYQEQAAAESAR